MATFHLLLIIWFHILFVTGYYTFIPAPDHSTGPTTPKYTDNALSPAPCPIKTPITTSCGVSSPTLSPSTDGSFVNSTTGVCQAQVGDNNDNGVEGIAICQSSSYSCEYIEGPESGTNVGDTSVVSCSSDEYTMTSWYTDTYSHTYTHGNSNTF